MPAAMNVPTSGSIQLKRLIVCRVAGFSSRVIERPALKLRGPWPRGEPVVGPVGANT